MQVKTMINGKIIIRQLLIKSANSFLTTAKKTDASRFVVCFAVDDFFQNAKSEIFNGTTPFKVAVINFIQTVVFLTAIVQLCPMTNRFCSYRCCEIALAINIERCFIDWLYTINPIQLFDLFL